MWEYAHVSLVFCLKLMERLFSFLFTLKIGFLCECVLYISELPSSRVQKRALTLQAIFNVSVTELMSIFSTAQNLEI